MLQSVGSQRVGHDEVTEQQGERDSESIIWFYNTGMFWFLVWGLHACGRHTINFSHVVGVSVCAKQLKVLLHTSLEGELGPCPKVAL